MTISPTKTQQSFFRAAEAVASLSDHNQAKLGCVLVDKHRIVSSGHNSSTRCSPLQKKMDVSRFGFPDQHKGPIHAETACLLPLIRQGYDMTYISSDATEMALWRFPDLAPVVCPFYGQTASGAYFIALKAGMRVKGFERSGYPYFVFSLHRTAVNLEMS